MRWLLRALLTTAAVVALGQNPSLPEGEGKAVVNGACTSCHGADQITAKTGTREEWVGIIDRMKGYGVTLDAKQTTTVVEYLAKSFPPKGATPPQAPQATPAGAQDDAAEAAGKALVNGVCASCHGVDLITGKQASRTDWQGVIDRMKGYGAAVDDKQSATLLDYLVKHYGPKQAATADAGKGLLEASCTSCHDLDLVNGRTGTQAEWQEIVDRMNGRGAGVPEKDVPVLVQYLFKTYPPK